MHLYANVIAQPLLLNINKAKTNYLCTFNYLVSRFQVCRVSKPCMYDYMYVCITWFRTKLTYK